MAKNVEIKAHTTDKFSIKEKLLKMTGSIEPTILMQKDVFYNFKYGRLKLRNINNVHNELIFYIRNNQKEPKKSSYFRIKVFFPSIANLILKNIFGVRGVVSKSRELYMFENVRIHLDSVINLGDFIEFEYLVDGNNSEELGYVKLDYLLQELNIERINLCSESYIDFHEPNNALSVSVDDF